MTDMMPTDNKICPLCRDPGFSYQAHGSSPTFAMGTDLVKKAERLQALGLSDKVWFFVRRPHLVLFRSG